MFKPIRYDSGKMEKIQLAVSQTVVKGNGLKWVGGYLAVIATGSYQDTRYVAMEDVTTGAAAHTACLVIPVEGVEFEADCDAVASIADRGTYADIATKATLDVDSSTCNDFYIVDIVGVAETSKVVRGYFTRTIA